MSSSDYNVYPSGPCPCCGQVNMHPVYANNTYSVVCANCFARTHDKPSFREAVDAWDKAEDIICRTDLNGVIPIKYETTITGMNPVCPHGKMYKVGSLACQQCRHNLQTTHKFVRRERVFRRSYSVYGGDVYCGALRTAKATNKKGE